MGWKTGPTFSPRTASARYGGRRRRKQKLYEQFGRLKMELEWLKKLLTSIRERRRMVDSQHYDWAFTADGM